jgi:hypothetical protein
VENTDLNFIKVKGHSGMKGNERTDELAKKRLELKESYIREKDLNEFKNRLGIWKDGEEIKGRYRTELKKIHLKEMKDKVREDDNVMWRKMQEMEEVEKMSNNFLKDRTIKKGVVISIIKGRTDLLPHAKQLYIRGVDNIYSPYCPWCEGKEEDTEHIMIECPHYAKDREEIWEKVIEIIRKGNPEVNNKEIMKIVIPRWFMKEERKEVICVFEKLKNFDKLGRMLGYISKALREVIKQYSQKRPGKNRQKRES